MCKNNGFISQQASQNTEITTKTITGDTMKAAILQESVKSGEFCKHS